MIMLQEDTRRSFGSVGDLGWVLGNCRNSYIIVSSCHMGPVCDWEKLVCMVYLCFSRVPLVHSLEALKHTILKKTESFHMQSRSDCRCRSFTGEIFHEKVNLKMLLPRLSPLSFSSSCLFHEGWAMWPYCLSPTFGCEKRHNWQLCQSSRQKLGRGSTWMSFLCFVRIVLMPPRRYLRHSSRSVLSLHSVDIPDTVCHLGPSPWTVSLLRARALS